jgi:hypothetical protein
MAWESRNGRGSYYTRSRKVDGHVVREYGGTGWEGENAELMDRIDRLDRDQAHYDAWNACQKTKELMNLLDVYCELVEGITRENLQATGYHQHHRGEWRKRRVQK